MKILFFGNCQTNALKTILNLDSSIKQTQIMVHLTEMTMDETETLIKEYDVIITQPISDNYRNKPYLSTTFLMKHKRDDTLVIMFDSIYFEMYHFDIFGGEYRESKIQDKIINQHYKGIIDCFDKGLSQQYFIDNFVNNENLKSHEELEKIASESIKRLEERHKSAVEKYNPTIYISTAPYIKENYKDKLLSYVGGHPSKHILQYVAHEVIHFLKLKNTIKYNVDPLAIPCHIIYKCVQKAVNFDISKYVPIVAGISGMENVVDMYYKCYSDYRNKNV